jgi:rhomboid protease GluP
MIGAVFQRKTTGSVVCPSCGSLVGVRDDKCYSCGRSNPGLWGFAPLLRQLGSDFGFVPLVVGACGVLYVLTLLVSGSELQIMGGGMSILAPSGRALLMFGMSGAYPVYVEGAWWTLLSASWLHGNLLHVVFNMYWVRRLGPDAVELLGPARTIIVYTVSGITGFLLSSTAGYIGIPLPLLRGASFTMGASASILGLVGALWHYGRKGGSSLIRAEVTQLIVWFAIAGLLMPGTDNYAHAGGFLGGYAASAALNPFTRERGDHVIVAIACLVATLLAIVVSLFHGSALLLR